MKKILVAIFADETEMDLDNLVPLLKQKGTISLDIIPTDDMIKYRDLVIDPKYRTVILNGKHIELTNYEFEILHLLAKSPGQVFSKEQIYNQVWKSSYYRAEDNVMSLIRRIRKKIEPNPAKPIYILTVWGIGYKFNSA